MGGGFGWGVFGESRFWTKIKGGVEKKVKKMKKKLQNDKGKRKKRKKERKIEKNDAKRCAIFRSGAAEALRKQEENLAVKIRLVKMGNLGVLGKEGNGS